MAFAKYILILVFLFSANSLQAGVLKGKVTDSKGTALPYSTIFIEGTTIGVSANGNGDFELPVAPGLYKVVCQYVGYQQSVFNLSISGSETITHAFVLKDQSLEMKEVVVRANAEDPAYPIIRNAIAKRKFHLKQVKSFQTAIYFKGVARSRKLPKKFMGQKVADESDAVDTAGKGILYLAEEDADYYADGDKEKTVIHSVHESGNKNGLGFSQFPHVITFYENNVSILGKTSRGFISPVSDNALFYYRYKLLGEFTEQGHTVYKISVKPKRDYEPCFSGFIYIVDEDWSIHSLNMVLVKQSGLDLMDTLKLEQLFLPLQKDTWVIKNQVIGFTINLFGFDITANGVAVYDKQKVNEQIPDSIFAGKVASTYDKVANKKDTAYWTESRPIQLEKDEVDNFIVKDSLNKKLSSPAHLDSVRRKENKIRPLSLLTWGQSFQGKNKDVYEINGVLLGLGTDNILNYNLVEGFNVAPRFSWRHKIDSSNNLHVDIATRYGFSNQHFNAVGRLYDFNHDKTFHGRWWLYGVEGGRYVFQYNPENPVLPFINTYSALFYRENDLKIYERWDASAFLSHNYGNGLTWFIKASYQQRLPYENTTDYSVIDGSKVGFTSNTPPHLLQTATAWEKHDAALIYASVSFKPGFTYTQYPDYKVANSSSLPLFTLNYEKGLPGIINSVSDFDKWSFSIAHDIDLKLLGDLKYNLVAGGFLNSAYVSIPDLMHVYGNRGWGYASPYLQSFQFAQYYDFSNKEKLYEEVHLEYHLKGLLSNKLPLLRQAGFHLLFGGNLFYVRQSDYYSEAFVGVDNIGWKLVRGLRIDFVQSWDSFNGRNSGVRFGFNLAGATIVTSDKRTHSEW